MVTHHPLVLIDNEGYNFLTNEWLVFFIDIFIVVSGIGTFTFFWATYEIIVLVAYWIYVEEKKAGKYLDYP